MLLDHLATLVKEQGYAFKSTGVKGMMKGKAIGKAIGKAVGKAIGKGIGKSAMKKRLQQQRAQAVQASLTPSSQPSMISTEQEALSVVGEGGQASQGGEGSAERIAAAAEAVEVAEAAAEAAEQTGLVTGGQDGLITADLGQVGLGHSIQEQVNMVQVNIDPTLPAHMITAADV